MLLDQPNRKTKRGREDRPPKEKKIFGRSRNNGVQWRPKPAKPPRGSRAKAKEPSTEPSCVAPGSPCRFGARTASSLDSDQDADVALFQGPGPRSPSTSKGSRIFDECLNPETLQSPLGLGGNYPPVFPNLQGVKGIFRPFLGRRRMSLDRPVPGRCRPGRQNRCAASSS